MDGRQQRIIDRLCEISVAASVGFGSGIEWPEHVEPDAWYMEPDLISLRRCAEYEALTEAERQRLSFFEAVNFFSLNVHGEKHLLAGLADCLHSRDFRDSSEYLHHFLDEENKHLYVFSRFCKQYADKIYGHANLAFPRQTAPGELKFLFFAKVLAFEEVVDRYNHLMGASETIHPLARAINQLHHQDETRHLVFGRIIVKSLFERYRSEWSDETLSGIRNQIVAYLGSMWRQYYNPEVYADAGLEQPYALAERVYASAAAVEHRRWASQKFVKHLLESSILLEEPL